MSYHLSVSVKLDPNDETMEDWTNVSNKLHKLAQKDCDGAGTGFGVREMDWSFKDEGDALMAAGRIIEEFEERLEHIEIEEETYDVH